jgi:outer membrane biosynthesis protein TonB
MRRASVSSPFVPRLCLGAKVALIALAVIAVVLYSRAAGADQPGRLALRNVNDDSAISASICPIVLPLDAFPSPQGLRYLFYGNAFFINDEGYLVTAAHVVSAFRNGGQPEVLVGAPGGPHYLVQATLVAADWAHDVAVLRATPNPFTKGYGVKFLPLTVARPALGKELLLVSLHPEDPQNSYSLETLLEDRVSGKFLNYEFSDGETEGSGRELIAVSQNVVAGQSGSPIIAADSHEVVGVALGRWLYPGLLSLAATAGPKGASPGAVLPIHYAIALLHDRGISWQSNSSGGLSAEKVVVRNSAQNVGQSGGQNGADAAGENGAPVPLSLVSTPYPPQALFGGEVGLDALIDASGKLEDLNVVHGQSPFVGPVLDAARTWSFEPARLNGRAVDARVGIYFQFPQSFLPPLAPREHTYDEPAGDSPDHAAWPIFTTEPDYPPNSVTEGTVAIYATIDRGGRVVSTEVLRDLAPLTDPTLSAIREWHFAPATRSGASVESAVVIVVTFRRPAVH